MIGMAMRYHATCYVLVLLVTAVLSPMHADAAALTMGQMQVVSTDGSLDVTRNPSLMAAQGTDNSLGVLLLYAPHATHRYSHSYYQDSSLLDGSARDLRHNAGTVSLSYCRKTAGGMIGLALDTDERYSGAFTRYKRTYTGIVKGSFSHTGIGGQLMRLSPRFVISYGGAVKGEHSLGVQCAAGYSFTRDDTDYFIVENFQPGQKHHSSKRTEEARAELSAGYLYRTADSQVGLMIRSGRFAWQKTKIYYNRADFFPSAYVPVTVQLRFAGSVSEPFAFKYDRAFGIIAGGYHRLARFIALALEGEFQVPIAYTIKDLRFDETTYFFALSQNLAVNRSGLICMRAGFEILPEGPVVISMGGTLRFVRESKKGMYLRETVRTEEYGGSLGLDIRAVDNLLIVTGARMTYTRERRKSEMSYRFFGSGANDGLTTFLHTDCFIGTSVGF